MVVKTFRGLLADGGEDRIRLSTIKGKVGYRIFKFQVIGINEDVDYETIVQIFKKSVTPSDSTDFTDSDLLAVALYGDATSTSTQAQSTVIFDQEIFNQDIFVSAKATTGSTGINYYIELEVIPLDDAGAEYTTLKDIRTRSPP